MNELIKILKDDGVGVLATDTVLGITASAFSQKAVERIYQLKKRDKKKPFIILIASINDLLLFNIKLASKEKQIIEKLWPGKVSIVLPCPDKKFSYLHRGTKSVAFRLPTRDAFISSTDTAEPKNEQLISLIKKTGPLVSTSVNISGMPPARNMSEAKKTFGNKLDFYHGRSNKNSTQSTLIKIKNNKIIVLREGAVSVGTFLKTLRNTRLPNIAEQKNKKQLLGMGI